jgi:glycerol-3-phosphate dehydrogenase
MRAEWAQSAEDVLWRRSKMGLHVGEATKQKIEAWFGQQGDLAERQETA